MNDGTLMTHREYHAGELESEKPLAGETSLREPVSSSVNQLMLLMEAVSEQYAASIHEAVLELAERVHAEIQASVMTSGSPTAHCRIEDAQADFDAGILAATGQLDAHRQWFLDEIRNLDNVLITQKFQRLIADTRVEKN